MKSSGNMKTFIKTIFKCIKDNKSRFISISLIIMIGVCFVTGLGGITPKVENSLDEALNDANASDIIIKTKNPSGFTLDEINKIKQIPEIDYEAITSFDVDGDSSLRIESLNFNQNNINKLKLVDGNFPKSNNEICVERSSNTIKKREIGESISFQNQNYKITGIVENPLIFTKDGDINEISNTRLDTIIYFNQNNYLPITTVYIKINNLKSHSYFQKNYINDVNTSIEDIKNTLKNDNYIYLTLKETKSYAFITEIDDKIDVIAVLFPIFFIAVVALVVLTTMTRLISEERKIIGCYKSLGYNNLAIFSKYIIYSSLCALLGIIVGLISGAYILPNIIYNVFKMIMFLPKMTSKISLTLGIYSAIFMYVSITLLTIYITKKEIKEKPASLFQAKSPTQGKKILLEKISFIWSKLSFKYKSCYRNIFRYKGRFFMIVLSVLGSTALVMAGLGLYNISSKPIAINGIAFDMGDSIKYVSIAVVIFALLLTVLVLYNITNMNISERNREIATLKVLGYKDYEVCAYIFREIIQTSLIGVIAGIPFGVLLLYVIMQFLDFGSLSDIKLISYFLTGILVILFIIIVDLLLIKKIKKVNMNDSLKSLE